MYVQACWQVCMYAYVRLLIYVRMLIKFNAIQNQIKLSTCVSGAFTILSIALCIIHRMEKITKIEINIILYFHETLFCQPRDNHNHHMMCLRLTAAAVQCKFRLSTSRLIRVCVCVYWLMGLCY